MTKLKLITCGVVGLALILAGGAAVWWVHGLISDRDKATAKAEKSESEAARLRMINEKLHSAVLFCNRSATEQSTIAADALDQRGTLSDIMQTTATSQEAGEFKGVQLNDAQKTRLITFYNGFFGDPSSLRID